MTEFEMVFHDNRGFIFKYLLKICKDESLAEELTQETFFRAYMNFRQVKNKNAVPAWLCSIAKNTYFAWYNEHKKLSPLDAIPEQPDLITPEDTVLHRELTEQAYYALQHLEEPYKEVFLLRVFGEMPFSEISFLFGKSESWARVTFYRARQKIRERIQ